MCIFLKKKFSCSRCDLMESTIKRYLLNQSIHLGISDIKIVRIIEVIIKQVTKANHVRQCEIKMENKIHLYIFTNILFLFQSYKIHHKKANINRMRIRIKVSMVHQAFQCIYSINKISLIYPISNQRKNNQKN